MSSLFGKPIDTLKGVGKKRAELFAKLGVPTVGDLLRFYPRTYEDWSQTIDIEETVANEVNVIKAEVLATPSEQRIRGGMILYKTTVADESGEMQLTFFNNPYIKSLLYAGKTYLFRGKVSSGFIKKEMTSPDFLPESRNLPILPVYPQTQGLSSRMISDAVKQALLLLGETVKDPLPAELRQQYELCHLSFALENIHFPKSEQELATAKTRLVFEEFLVLQLGLMKIKSRRKENNVHLVSSQFPDEFAELLPFELTGAQKRAIQESIDDMAGKTPMNRLIQGDVGSGKTAVAAALCFAVIKSGKQAAFMAPTEILANQHFNSLQVLLEKCGIKVELLTGSVTPKNKKRIAEELIAGEIDLLIGTHALISETVAFKNLGLVITDEQHRFGVGQRSALAQKGEHPHLLVMSATPIPRTLALMIYGDLDISILNELPPGRQKIETFLIDSGKRRRAFGYVQKHLEEGRQGYLICPLIEEGESELTSVTAYAKIVAAFFPKNTIGILHGKMKAKEKEQVMQNFAKGELDLLVATTVVEVGVDVPNAVIMLIENAERYGLSQLHQLRGRIGRGKHKSTCILVSDSQQEDTIERLKIICSSSDGFKIADADLKLRGPGDFFGKRQHGLPQLKIADMMSDIEILKKSQECARQLLESEEIQEEPYRFLRAEIRLLFSKSQDLTFN
ncbi:ATP-dependent DNA helicase RecG [Scatolibacter rhodanostii]|uniref:ATP-dependent DNA helicase RecG n=1 Tax=Scatolibacter rhodanostii TaxID=2014781 RepID=UPI000C083E8A|nr:ATP-dependent DNA helicase RecG [Scatolibacter rhodanostii]